MPILRRILILVLAVLVLGAGVGLVMGQYIKRWSSARTAQTKPTPSSRPARLDIRPIEEEAPATASLPLEAALAQLDFERDPKAFHAFQVIVQARLHRDRFEELEAFAEKARAEKLRFPGGGWKLYNLIRDLGRYQGGRDRPDADWLDHMRHIQDWMRRFPDSLTAREAYAEALTGFAWKARGSGWASTVTPEGWELFRQRLREARTTLEQIPPARRRCPMWYRVMLTVALGQSWERAEYDQLFREAVRVEPAFQHFHTARAYSLLPRWHGEEGDWERFMEESADAAGGEAGDALYYAVALAQTEFYEESKFYREHKVSWPRVKRGFAAIERAHGMDNASLHTFCRQSGLNVDRPTALAILQRLGEDCNEEVWGTRATLDDFKDWAHQRGKYACSPRASAHKP